MKTFRLHLSALLLLCCSTWACAAWYLSCPAGTANGTTCTQSLWNWHAVGSYVGTGRAYYGSDTRLGSQQHYYLYDFVGTVIGSYQCSVQPGAGQSCTGIGGTASYTDMVILSPVSCIPSPRTIDPCPSGYAPSSVLGTGPSALDSYSSAFEKLPIQDMLYGIGMAICGLLGLGVGTRLV